MIKKSIPIILIIVLIAVGTAIAGYYAVLKSDQPNTMTSTEITEVVDTSDWNTYRNNEFNFELMYPNGWQVRDTNVKTVRPESISSIEFSPAFFTIRIYNNEQNLALNKWYSLTFDGSERSKELKEITIGDLKALEVSSFIMGNKMMRTFFSIPDKLVISLEFQILGPDIKEGDTKLYKALQSTFKLVERQSR